MMTSRNKQTNEDCRFSISAEKYLSQHCLLIYIEDAINQLLEAKDENPKIVPSKFFGDYFSSVRDGNHVLFRDFAYIQATLHNRACFVRTFWKCFRHIGRKGDLLSIREYHSLVCLLCADFPFQPVQKTARIILMEDAMDCLISFSDFLYAFQTQFCFEEFLIQCADVYKKLLEDPPLTPKTPVVIPTTEELHIANDAESIQRGPSEATDTHDAVDSSAFLRLLLPICEEMDLRAPPVPVLREILMKTRKITFYGFLMAMAKSESLNKAIDKLPSKASLLDISAQDMPSQGIRAIPPHIAPDLLHFPP